MLNTGYSIDNTHIGSVIITEDLTVEGETKLEEIEVKEIKIEPPGCVETDCLQEITANTFELKNNAGATVAGIVNTNAISVPNQLRTNYLRSIAFDGLQIVNSTAGGDETCASLSDNKFVITNEIDTDLLKEKTLDSFQLQNVSGDTILQITNDDELKIPVISQMSEINSIGTANFRINWNSIPRILLSNTGGVTINNSYQLPLATAPLGEMCYISGVGQMGFSSALKIVGGNVQIKEVYVLPPSMTTSTGATIRQSSASETEFTDNLRVLGTGEVKISDAFTLPSADGTANQVILSAGDGTTSWVNIIDKVNRNVYTMDVNRSTYTNGVWQDIDTSGVGSKHIDDANFPIGSVVRVRVNASWDIKAGAVNIAQGQIRLQLATGTWYSQNLVFNADLTGIQGSNFWMFQITRTALGSIRIGLNGTANEVTNMKPMSFGTSDAGPFRSNIDTASYFLASGLDIDVQWRDSSVGASYIRLLASSYNIDLVTAGIPAGTFTGTTDHTALDNLTLGDSGHTQFALLAGRTGGQVIEGSDTSGESLTLASNSVSHVTGSINFDSAMDAKSNNISNVGNLNGKVADDLVTGPASAVSTNLASYNGITGKILQDSAIATADVFLRTGTVAMTGNLNMGSNNITSLGNITTSVVSPVWTMSGGTSNTINATGSDLDLKRNNNTKLTIGTAAVTMGTILDMNSNFVNNCTTIFFTDSAQNLITFQGTTTNKIDCDGTSDIEFVHGATTIATIKSTELELSEDLDMANNDILDCNTITLNDTNDVNAGTLTVEYDGGVSVTSYTITMPTAVGSTDDALVCTNGTGTLEWSKPWTTSWGDIHLLDNATETTITAATTLVSIGGTFAGGELSGFTANTSGYLTKTSAGTQTFRITYTMVWETVAGPEQTCRAKVKIGGVEIANSELHRPLDGGSGYPVESSCTFLAQIDNTDTVEPFVANQGATDNILVSWFHMAVTEV